MCTFDKEYKNLNDEKDDWINDEKSESYRKWFQDVEMYQRKFYGSQYHAAFLHEADTASNWLEAMRKHVSRVLDLKIKKSQLTKNIQSFLAWINQDDYLILNKFPTFNDEELSDVDLGDRVANGILSSESSVFDLNVERNLNRAIKESRRILKAKKSGKIPIIYTKEFQELLRIPIKLPKIGEVNSAFLLEFYFDYINEEKYKKENKFESLCPIRQSIYYCDYETHKLYEYYWYLYSYNESKDESKIDFNWERELDISDLRKLLKDVRKDMPKTEYENLRDDLWKKNSHRGKKTKKNKMPEEYPAKGILRYLLKNHLDILSEGDQKAFRMYSEKNAEKQNMRRRLWNPNSIEIFFDLYGYISEEMNQPKVRLDPQLNYVPMYDHPKKHTKINIRILLEKLPISSFTSPLSVYSGEDENEAKEYKYMKNSNEVDYYYAVLFIKTEIKRHALKYLLFRGYYENSILRDSVWQIGYRIPWCLLRSYLYLQGYLTTLEHLKNKDHFLSVLQSEDKSFAKTISGLSDEQVKFTNEKKLPLKPYSGFTGLGLWESLSFAMMKIEALHENSVRSKALIQENTISLNIDTIQAYYAFCYSWYIEKNMRRKCLADINDSGIDVNEMIEKIASCIRILLKIAPTLVNPLISRIIDRIRSSLAISRAQLIEYISEIQMDIEAFENAHEEIPAGRREDYLRILINGKIDLVRLRELLPKIFRTINHLKLFDGEASKDEERVFISDIIAIYMILVDIDNLSKIKCSSYKYSGDERRLSTILRNSSWGLDEYFLVGSVYFQQFFRCHGMDKTMDALIKYRDSSYGLLKRRIDAMASEEQFTDFVKNIFEDWDKIYELHKGENDGVLNLFLTK